MPYLVHPKKSLRWYWWRVRVPVHVPKTCPLKHHCPPKTYPPYCDIPNCTLPLFPLVQSVVVASSPSVSSLSEQAPQSHSLQRPTRRRKSPPLIDFSCVWTKTKRHHTTQPCHHGVAPRFPWPHNPQTDLPYIGCERWPRELPQNHHHLRRNVRVLFMFVISNLLIVSTCSHTFSTILIRGDINIIFIRESPALPVPDTNFLFDAILP